MVKRTTGMTGLFEVLVDNFTKRHVKCRNFTIRTHSYTKSVSVI